MSKTRHSLIFLTLCALFFARAACGEIRLAFIFERAENPAHAAFYKGAQDSCAESAKVHKKAFSFAVRRATTDSEIADALNRAFLDGKHGALLCPAAPPGEKTLKALSELQKRGFVCAAAGKYARDYAAAAKILDDESAALKLLLERLEEHGGSMDFRLLSFIGMSAGNSALSENFTKSVLEKFSSQPKQISQYSMYAQQNRVEIMRLTNYALFFLTPEPLLNAEPFRRDAARLFAACLGGAPQLADYLKGGQLDMVITPDYYGHGYLALREAANRLCGAQAKETLSLPLKIYAPADAEAYAQSWKIQLGAAWEK